MLSRHKENFKLLCSSVQSFFYICYVLQVILPLVSLCENIWSFGFLFKSFLLNFLAGKQTIQLNALDLPNLAPGGTPGGRHSGKIMWRRQISSFEASQCRLPVYWRIDFRILVLTFKARYGLLSYVSDLLMSCKSLCGLQSSCLTGLHVLWTTPKLSECLQYKPLRRVKNKGKILSWHDPCCHTAMVVFVYKPLQRLMPKSRCCTLDSFKQTSFSSSCQSGGSWPTYTLGHINCKRKSRTSWHAGLSCSSRGLFLLRLKQIYIYTCK